MHSLRATFMAVLDFLEFFVLELLACTKQTDDDRRTDDNVQCEMVPTRVATGRITMTAILTCGTAMF